MTAQMYLTAIQIRVDTTLKKILSGWKAHGKHRRDETVRNTTTNEKAQEFP